ncbi:patatin-like phospholipase family protein [Sphingomonas quercus]|uniref:Patatin-like phospholipase family protein n=1 Tax=Sphingomonas quercus TaxID=2842451 RepID=A0ABS6BIM7_9SPHN|nr:patatin-like phospholipase family protein [Sphingomonas quercus]MBU3078163.1 patatin-like phospholipase family protein [Sphingomonas quercus]
MSEVDPRRHRSHARMPLPDQVALVLQGGGALGAYQAGVYEALAEAGIEVDHVAGISIGAVNAALIAGNPPERRVERLRTFWDRLGAWLPSFPIWHGDQVREAMHGWSAGFVSLFGVPGFFGPRPVSPFFAVPGSCEAMSFYDPTPLAKTLDELVDWDRVNNGPVRLSVGAVELESGNFRFFDTASDRIDARHVMASGALPPGLPPVEIDGKYWWDGGLVSNTPLSHVLDTQTTDLLIFQVDLFSASSGLPKTILDVMARAKEIQFSSRTRQVSDTYLKRRQERELVRRVLARLPEGLRDDPEVQALEAQSRENAVNLVQLIYRANAWEGGQRDYEFSARAAEEHMAAGRAAVAATMDSSALLARNILDGRTAAFDLTPR